ncbi:MAG: hypothetical protein IKX74_04285 [Erysipelotrichaceae bacterium]|nr:hypothetical protein [Erysipelotrichaceae bacterium]
MKKNEDLSALQQLKDRFELVGQLKTETEEARKALKTAKALKPSALESFDAENLENFVTSRQGPQPVKPEAVIKLGAGYRARMEEYRKAMEEYQQRDEQLRKEYYEHFQAQRHELEVKEKAEIAGAVDSAKKQLSTLQEKLAAARRQLEEDDTLSSRLKNLKTVNTLIGYFEDRRADSLKEAVNLLFEEQHRKKAEENIAQLQQQTAIISSQLQQNEKKINDVLKKANDIDRTIGRINWRINN